MRYLILMHRYLGIAIGILMTGWCLTGIVMMYVRYPALSQSERLQHLPRLDLHTCCRIGERELPAQASITHFQIESLGTHPVLSLQFTGTSRSLIDLTTGAPITQVSVAEAAVVAGTRGTRPRLLSTLSYDQWTVSGEFNRARPLYQFALDDADDTHVYVSSKSGRVIQITTGHQRFWNWLGTVPHWLYFTQLRHQPTVWTQVVICTSLAGCFLTVFGLYLGIHHFLRRPRGRWSGYRGLLYWHHVPGLVFGLFALTWVASGLISMNPWGFLESGDSEPELDAMVATPLPASTFSQWLQRLPTLPDANKVVALESVALWAQPAVVETLTDGSRRRVNLQGRPVPLAAADWNKIAAALGAGKAVPVLLNEGDAYYHSRPGVLAPLPVYRIIRHDDSGTRFYFDPVTAAPLQVINSDARWYRWLHVGLHTFDFTGLIRSRPLWDIVMIVLLAGAALVCGTGTWAGWRRHLPVTGTRGTGAHAPRSPGAARSDP